MLLKNPILKSGLKPIQRLCYLSSMTFWFFPLPRLIFMAAPLLYIFFDMKIVVANVEEAIAYTATYIIVNLMMQNYLYGRVRWPFVSELYEYVQGLFLIKATASVIVSPRKPTFKVTAKNVSLDHDQLSPLALPYFLVFALLFFGAVVSAYRYAFEPGVTNLMLVVGLWNLFSLITAGAALGVAAERRQTEKAPSLAVDRPAVLNLNGMALDVTVERISSARCRIRLDAVLPLRRAGDGSVGTLSALPQANLPLLSHARTIPVRLAGVTAAGEESVCDLVFETLTPGSYFALADLMYGDADAMVRFQQRRRAHKDIVSGTLQFIRWGITGPIRAFACLVTPAPEVEEPAARPRSAERQRASDPGRPTDSKPTRTAEGHAAGVPTSDASPSWLQLMVEPESTAGGTERGRRAADLTDADLLPTRAG
jgi:cellulose synthase (UDP-forming)